MSSRKMRLFTGIAIPEAVIGRLETTVASLRPAAAIRWSPLGNLHITTKFIGGWAEERLEELKQALAGVDRPGNLRIAISGFGYYPNSLRPKVFFAAVRAPGIESLHAAIEDALEPLGCEREDRPYSPHLTLARVGREDIRNLRERIGALKDSDFGSFTATEFHLYLNQPGPNGSIYTRLVSFGMAGGMSAESEAIAC